MSEEIAISVQNVSKTFRIFHLAEALCEGGPHEKVSSLRGAFVGMFSSFHLPFRRGGRGGVSYEEFKALDDVSFEVKKGEFFGIIGRNDSEKQVSATSIFGILTGAVSYDTIGVPKTTRSDPFRGTAGF